MTIDDTLNATLFAIEQVQLDLLFGLQTGEIDGPTAVEALRAFDLVRVEFRKIREAADHSPELYSRYAAPGGSANRPSIN